MTTSKEKSQVLIVDDEEAICKLISHLLEQEGFAPLVALDGKTALQQVRTASPDMMIVDLKLPDLDGLEILRQAKALDEDLPVVILTVCWLLRPHVPSAAKYSTYECGIKTVPGPRIEF